MTSTHFTNFNIAKLRFVSCVVDEKIKEGGEGCAHITLHNDSGSHKYDLELKIGPFSSSHPVTISPGQRATFDIKLKGLERGPYSFGRVRLFTTFPFGLFYAWSYLRSDTYFTVFPLTDKEVELAQRRESHDIDDSQNSLQREGVDEFDSYKDYEKGSSWKRVDWKAFAREKGLIVKRFVSHEEEKLLFNIDDLDGGIEERVRVLASMIELADENGLSYELIIDNEVSKNPLLELAHYQKKEVELEPFL